VKRIQFRSRAQGDLDAIWSFIAAKDVAAADRLIDDIHAAVRRLIENPLSAPERPWLPSGHRGMSIRKHIVVYSVEGPSILIQRVIDGRRDLMRAFRE